MALAAAVNLGFSDKWANRIFTILGLLLGVAGIVLAVILAPGDAIAIASSGATLSGSGSSKIAAPTASARAASTDGTRLP